MSDAHPTPASGPDRRTHFLDTVSCAAPRRRAFTIAEILVAMTIFGLLMIGILSALIYSHRTAQESICQNAAYSNTRGALEQILRGVSFGDLPYTDSSNALRQGTGVLVSLSDAAYTTKRSIPVVFNGNTNVTLQVSTGALPDLGTLVAGGSAPSNTPESTVFIDINNTPTLSSDDLELRLWLWIKDASQPSIDATQVRSIYLVYHWCFKDGNQSRWHVGVQRNMRSSAPTF